MNWLSGERADARPPEYELTTMYVLRAYSLNEHVGSWLDDA